MYKLGKTRATSWDYRPIGKSSPTDGKRNALVNRIRKNRKAAKAARRSRKINRK